MLFNSYSFIFFFLPTALVVFYLIGGRGHHRVAIAWLVAASLFFYGWWNPAYLGLILFSMLFNYAVGVSLGQERERTIDRRRLILALGIGINLLLLGYFKYANFFVDSVNAVFDTGYQLQKIVLPLAISFFTFQQIAYLVDAYRGLTREYNFLHYCLFVTFFPQLIAGPIVHHGEMLPQFARKKTYHPDALNLAIGITIFSIGLFKKVVIADNVAGAASPVFAAAENRAAIDFFTAWTGAFAYTFQLYFDFSGYSDMAIGLGRMFGIRLPVNFNSPYQATSIIDFWRRWHITLSRFLRDYLYIPLGGSHRGTLRRYLNLFVTMLLGGLWHGAGWTFVIWGGLHGLYLMVNNLWRRIWRWRIDRWWSRGIARVVTFLAVVVGWVFFRAESFGGALHLLRAMTNLPSTLHHRIGPLESWLTAIGFSFQGGYLALQHLEQGAWLVLFLALVWGWPNTQQLLARFKPALDAHLKPAQQPFHRFWQRYSWQPNGGWALITALISAAALLSLSRISEFLYFQF
ncbi:MAG TPA: MBOAT family protein [Sedimenticola sp.]|nr:MBOAT family protein [Sedimenticola sp.]